jgi:hypothetical protein
MWVISCLAEDLLVFQKGLHCIELALLKEETLYFKTYNVSFNWHWLTPWRSAPVEKLTVAQFVKKNPSILWNSRVHCCVHKRPPLAPAFRRIAVPTPLFLRCICYPNLKSSVSLLEELDLASFSHSFGFPIRTLCTFRLSLSSHVAWSFHPLSIYLIILIF